MIFVLLMGDNVEIWECGNLGMWKFGNVEMSHRDGIMAEISTNPSQRSPDLLAELIGREEETERFGDLGMWKFGNGFVS